MKFRITWKQPDGKVWENSVRNGLKELEDHIWIWMRKGYTPLQIERI